MTGTLRAPFECLSISLSFALSNATSMYSASLPKSDRALSVYGQPALPNMMVLSAMIILLLFYEIYKMLSDYISLVNLLH
jgi:hypothetical protein